MKRLPLTVLSMLGLTLCLPAQAADRPTTEALTAFFEDVAFGVEFPELSGPRHQLLRWEGPIKFSIKQFHASIVSQRDGNRAVRLRPQSVSSKARQHVLKHLNRVADITGLPVAEASSSSEPPNLHISIVPTVAKHYPYLIPGNSVKSLQFLAKNGSCFATIRPEEGDIREAFIVNDSNLSDVNFDSCFLEEIIQILGLLNDSDMIKPSIFNHWDSGVSLTRTDVILLSAFYDPALKAGMPKEQVMRLIPPILDRLNRTVGDVRQ